MRNRMLPEFLHALIAEGRDPQSASHCPTPLFAPEAEYDLSEEDPRRLCELCNDFASFAVSVRHESVDDISRARRDLERSWAAI